MSDQTIRAHRALRRARASVDIQCITLDAAVAAADTLITQDLTPAARDVARTLQGALQALRVHAPLESTIAVVEASEPNVRRRPRGVSLSRLVHAALSHAAALAAVRGMNVDVELDPALPSAVRVDGPALRRALDQMLGAALAAAPTGGLVMRVERGPPAPTQHTLASGEDVELCITVSLERRRFPATEAPAVPISFGVAAETSRELMGSYHVEAADDGQPRATLRLTLEVEDPAPLAAAVGPRRVGLVGEELQLRERLTATLTHLGADVVPFSDVPALVEESTGTFDVIFVMRGATSAAVPDELSALDARVRVPERDVVLIGTHGLGATSASSAWAATRRTLMRPLSVDKIVAALRGEPFGRQTEAPASVLVVDSDPEARGVLRRFLEESGHRVVLAETSGDGVNAALAHPRPDLVVISLELPGLDGFGAYEALRSMERHAGLLPVPAVALTAHAFSDVEARVRDAGMSATVRKPVRRSQLIDVVAQHADHRPPMILLDEDDAQRERLVQTLTAQSTLRVVAAADVEDVLRCIRDRRVRRVAVALRRRASAREATRTALGVPARLAEVRNPPPRAVALLDAPDEWLRTAALAAGFSEALPVSDVLALAVALDGEGSLLPQAAHAEDEARAFVDDDLVDLVGPFLRRQQAELERAHQAIESAAFEDVRRVGHRLRGTAGGFGLDELASLGTRLEQAAAARDAAASRAAAVEARRLVATVRIFPRSTMARR